MLGIRFQLTPQLADYHAHTFEIACRVALPDRLREILMSAGLVGVGEQILQYQKFLRRQMADAPVRAGNLTGFQIDGTVGQRY